MIGVLVTQKVADWNFHKYVGFFHNYLFDMLGEYLATGNIDYAKILPRSRNRAYTNMGQKLSYYNRVSTLSRNLKLSVSVIQNEITFSGKVVQA